TQGMHSGIFHGVENATQIRDLIRERLRRFRESGLGDPEELRKAEPGLTAPVPCAGPNELLEAGRGLLAEARRLRAAIGRD
ncbi:MAG: PH domain-containing protein, partial [Limisphaerales bacterium]